MKARGRGEGKNGKWKRTEGRRRDKRDRTDVEAARR